MKIHLFHRQEILNGMPFNLLTHVKVLSPDGRYLAFAKVTPALLEHLRGLDIEIPDHLLSWKGQRCFDSTQKDT